MHAWHCSTKPTPSYDGQLHVDQFGTVYEWYFNTVGSCWKRTEYRLKKTREYNIYMAQFLRITLPRCPGRLNQEWDALHKRSFVKIQWTLCTPVSGPNPLYLANITHAELIDVLQRLTPPDPWQPVLYQGNATVTVYEVFDEERDAKVLAYNELYSQARGYLCYNRKHGRLMGKRWHECAANFQSKPGGFWGDAWTYPGAQILANIVGGGMAPNTDESNEIIWFHSSSRGLYRQPKVGKAVKQARKKLWDGDLGAFRLSIPAADTLTIGAPWVFFTRYGMWTRELEPAGYLRGTRYWYFGMKAVLVYPLHQGAAAPGGQWALLMKPYGVDTVGIGHQIDANWKVAAEFCYDTVGGEHEPITRLIGAHEGWDNWNQLHRVYFHLGIGMPNCSSNSDSSISSPVLPEFVRFYALNTTTGLRSKLFSRGLRTVKRKCNVTSNLEPAVFSVP